MSDFLTFFFGFKNSYSLYSLGWSIKFKTNRLVLYIYIL